MLKRMLGFFPPFQEAELQRVKKVRELELVYARAQLELEVSKAQQLAEVEVKKFRQMTEALGPSTIRDLAVAGPEMQVRVGESVAGWWGVCLGTIYGTKKAEPGWQTQDLERRWGQRGVRGGGDWIVLCPVSFRCDALSGTVLD